MIKFPDMKEIDDPHYHALKDKKDALIQSGGLDADAMHEDAQEQAETDTGPDLHAIADQVANNVDEYVSVHGGNKTEYLDKDLIEVDFELSGPKADKVKKLVQRKGVAP